MAISEDDAAELADFLNSFSGTSVAATRMRLVVDDDGKQVGPLLAIGDAAPEGRHVFWFRRTGRPLYTVAEVQRVIAGLPPLARNVQLPDDVGLLIERLMQSDPRLTSNVDALRFALETTLNLYPVEGSPDE